MEINITEVAYNNKVKAAVNEILLDADSKKINVNFSDSSISGTISFKYDEIRMLWAKLTEVDQESSKEINGRFDDNLYNANMLANRLSLDRYEDENQKIDDMKKFVILFCDLVENTKLKMVAAKENPKENRIIDSESSNLMEKKKKFDEDAKQVSEHFESKFPQKRFEGDAISFEELLNKLEVEKNKIKQEEQKRFEELKAKANELKETISYKKNAIKKAPQNTENLNKDVHVDSDYVKVEPFDNNKDMEKFTKRSSKLDIIDYSKL